MSANDRQEGGDHYRKQSGEQHWDRLVRLYGLEKARCYFIGNITAYVERYLEKDGIKDLKKARHYIDKLIELEEADLTLEVAKAQPPKMEPTKLPSYPGNPRLDNGRLLCGCFTEKCMGHPMDPIGEAS